jgi:hypothetical protein
MGPDGVRQLVPATTAPTAIVAAVGYSLEVEELVVKLTQEGEDDAIDELAVDGPEGKPWHPSPSPCMHALHAFPSPTDPGKNGDGPSAKILFGFELDDIHAWSQGASLAGPCTSSIDNDSGHCSFSSLIIYSGVLYYNFSFLTIQFYFFWERLLDLMTPLRLRVTCCLSHLLSLAFPWPFIRLHLSSLP